MIRLACRQMRLAAATTATLLVALVLVLVLTERSMTSFVHSSGLSSCLVTHGDCSLPSASFTNRYGYVIDGVIALTFLPILAGLFWGAPLISREVEQGTHRLAWTQSISRGRWLAIRLGIFVAGAILVAAVLTELFTWWFRPFAQLGKDGAGNYSRINPNIFDSEGIVLITATLFAFALGTAAGAVIRRTVPAMAVTLAGYLGVRLTLQALRGHFLAPLSVTYPLAGTDPRSGRGDWTISRTIVDGSGHTVSYLTFFSACPKDQGRTAAGSCAAAHGFQLHALYQPMSRFWPLQGIESGIYLAAAVALFAIAAWWALRRIS